MLFQHEAKKLITSALSRSGNVASVFARTITATTSGVGMENPVTESIRSKLREKFQPSFLDVINESYVHNVPKGSETHFKVVVVSDAFHNKTLVQRHRMVFDTLQEELQSGVHALSVVAKTRNQWTENEKVESSPKCLGGFGK